MLSHESSPGMLALIKEPLLLHHASNLVFLDLFNYAFTGLLIPNQYFRPDILFKLVLRHLGYRVPKLRIRLLRFAWVFEVY